MRASRLGTFCARHLLPQLPVCGRKGSLLYLGPLTPLLRGFLFESSAFSKDRIRVDAFIQPLYVPSSHLSLTFARRLGGGAHFWDLTAENEPEVARDLLDRLRAEGLPFLEQASTPRALAQQAARISSAPDNPYTLEAIAYSLVYDGQARPGLGALARLQAALQRLEPSLAWPRAMLDRAIRLGDAVARDPNEARGMLEEWNKDTLAALRLDG